MKDEIMQYLSDHDDDDDAAAGAIVSRVEAFRVEAESFVTER
jgi:hypothetical protein